MKTDDIKAGSVVTTKSGKTYVATSAPKLMSGMWMLLVEANEENDWTHSIYLYNVAAAA